MAKLSWEDLDEFLELEVDNGFAIEVTIQGATGNVNGIFFQDYEDLITGDTGISTSTPAFLCKTEVLPQSGGRVTIPIQNVLQVIGGPAFFIDKIEPDGTGLTLLRLIAK